MSGSILAAAPGLLFIAALAGLGDEKALEGGPSAPAPGTAPQHVLQIRAKELWTAAGQRIPDGVLIVADGHVRSIGSAKDLDLRQPVIVHDGVVSAGLIACRSQSGASGELQDDTRSVLPEAHAANAFDPESRDFDKALAAGITSLVLCPSGENLVGGFSCVVKTSGGRVLAREASLALSLSGAALGRSTAQSAFLLGAAEAGQAQPDGGPETSARSTRGTREPTSYTGALAMLRKLFSDGRGAFGRARKGELPVTIEAWDRHEVLRAMELAKEQGLSGAIRGAPLAGDPDVLAALHGSGLGVIVGPFSAAQTRTSLESVVRLGEAGIPVAFALDAPARSPEELRLHAARALAAGASRELVWKALTSDAARLAGVAAAVGELAPEREADFVLWSGDPLDLSSHVVAVYVDGVRAWPAPSHR